MPIYLLPEQKKLPFIVARAANPLTRMIGLLSTDSPIQNRLLLFSPCRSIHTFGMKYSLDAVAVAEDGRILAVIQNIPPNKTIGFPGGTKAVVEGAVGWIAAVDLQSGSRIQIVADENHKIDPGAFRRLLHWPMNILLAILWFRLVLALTFALRQELTFLNTAVLIHNSLLMIFFLIRRESKETSFKILDWLIPFAVLIVVMSFRPAPGTFFPDALAVVIQSIGIVAVIFSLGSLGRSFGIIPANRSVQNNGAYRIVRHPLYSAEIIFYLGYVVGNPSLRNVILFVILLSGQIWRALAEEKLLMNDPLYREYAGEVRYRFIPRIF